MGNCYFFSIPNATQTTAADSKFIYKISLHGLPVGHDGSSVASQPFERSNFLKLAFFYSYFCHARQSPEVELKCF